MEDGRRTITTDEEVRFWTLNLKYVNLIDMVAFAVVVRLFVFPPIWS